MENNVQVCQKGCHKYKQTMDEVVDTVGKEKNAATAWKDVCSKQKKKLSELRAVKMSMQNRIDQLDLDLEFEKNMSQKFVKKNRTLKLKWKP